MRWIAAVLLVALLLPAAAATLRAGEDGCCCATGAGASCPMKRSGASCSMSAGATCGMARSDFKPVTFPNLSLLPRPAMLTDAITQSVEQNASPFDRPHFRFATRARRAPDAPPPKFA